MKLKVPANAAWLEYMGAGHEEYHFMCPGCKFEHRVIVKWGDKVGKTEPKWEFNGNLDAPTFKPSLLVQWHNAERKLVCHSFITDGMIQFLPDSTHVLAGQTVPLEDQP